MAGIEKKSLDSPDETRTPDKTKVDVVDLGGTKIGRFAMEPGWRWSECIKPVVGGDFCQVHHVGYAESGTMHIVHNDGTEQELTAGDAYVIEPGHDAWVVGNEPFVGYEFDSKSAAEYAKGT